MGLTGHGATHAPRKSEEKIMLNIVKVDHVGIRVSDKDRSIAFYEGLGYKLMADAGFEQ